MTTLTQILDAIGHPRILVIGDLILDRYTFGNAERVSPEAPVVVLRVDSKEVRLGGAASVAMLLRGLEAEVTLAGVIGDDLDGRTLQTLLRDEQIDSQLVLVDSTRPTTTKERILGRAANRHAHQIVRVDHETRDPVGASLEKELVGKLVRAASCRLGEPSDLRTHRRPDGTPLAGVTSFDAILISDYAKGVCTSALLRRVIGAARACHVPVIVDPARISDYSRYAGVTLLKPNRAEAELATGIEISAPGDACAAAEILCGKHDLNGVLVTLDRDGMVLVQAASCRFPSPSSILDPPSSSSLHVPTTPHEVYDITGAGDMVLATLGICLASQVPLPQSVQLANMAAGLEVEKLGVAPVTRDEVARALVQAASCRFPSHDDAPTNPGANAPGSPSSILHPRSSSASKLIDLPTAVALAASCRAREKKIAFTNGCFDLLHVGHVTCLEQAAALVDVLIVAINSDVSVCRLKGPGRPIIPERDRAVMVAALDCVDHVLIFDEPTPHFLLEQIRPDILAKGGTTAEIIGHEVVESYGGVAVRLGEIPGASTTAIVSQLQTAHTDSFRIPNSY
ncbi:MAG TPA: bifunctional heptose 7-phosphate kinase/heptose 1-phosphate adenyltransferase [Planctomycetaceae bacterium]